MFSSIALDRKDTIHISYPGFTDARENALKYATKSSDASPPCQPVNIADQKNMNIAVGTSEQETITIICEDGTPVAGETVKAKVKSGKDMVAVSPLTTVTDNDGQTVFTITAVNKPGKAKIEFKDKKAGLKTKVKVEVIE